MGNDDQGKNDVGNQEEVLSRLESLEKILDDNVRQRKLKSSITGVGVALIVVAIVLFVYNTYRFGKEYDHETLLLELKESGARMAKDKEIATLIHDIKENMLPKLRDEILKKLKADMPQLKKETFKATDNLQAYLHDKIRKKILVALADSIKKIETDLLTKYKGLSAEEVNEVVQDAQELFIEQLGQTLDKYMALVSKDLTSLNQSFETLTHDPDYKQLQNENLDDVKNQLIESALEMCIYQVNPDRGDQLISRGGAK
jgi:hypothetical protein